MDFAKLEEKLKNAGVPEKIAHRYTRFYERGLINGIDAFENDELPSDDCFKTLAEVYETFYKSGPLNMYKYDFKRLLSIPYSRIEECRKMIADLFPKYSQEIPSLYKVYLQIYNKHSHVVYDMIPYGVYTRYPDEIIKLFELISGMQLSEEKTWQIFKTAVRIDYFRTLFNFRGVVEAVGVDLAPEVIYQTSVNGYLLSPFCWDVSDALKELRKKFDEKDTAKYLIENPEYLYLFKTEVELSDDLFDLDDLDDLLDDLDDYNEYFDFDAYYDFDDPDDSCFD